MPLIMLESMPSIMPNYQTMLLPIPLMVPHKITEALVDMGTSIPKAQGTAKQGMLSDLMC